MQHNSRPYVLLGTRSHRLEALIELVDSSPSTFLVQRSVNSVRLGSIPEGCAAEARKILEQMGERINKVWQCLGSLKRTALLPLPAA